MTYTKDELQKLVDELRPWHYCHIFPYGISTGSVNIPVESEKLQLLLDAAAFPKVTYPAVLDLGANSGLISMWFVGHKSSHVLAVENDERFYKQLELAIRAKDYEGKIVPLFADATTEDFGVKQFDLVLNLGLMHHIDSELHSDVYDSCYEALKPGGDIVVQTIHNQNVPKRLKEAGFRVVKVEGYAQGDRLAWVGTRPLRS